MKSMINQTALPLAAAFWGAAFTSFNIMGNAIGRASLEGIATRDSQEL